MGYRHEEGNRRAGALGVNRDPFRRCLRLGIGSKAPDPFTRVGSFGTGKLSRAACKTSFVSLSFDKNISIIGALT